MGISVVAELRHEGIRMRGLDSPIELRKRKFRTVESRSQLEKGNSHQGRFQIGAGLDALCLPRGHPSL